MWQVLRKLKNFLSASPFSLYYRFLDSYSRYLWLFPKTCKSDVFFLFLLHFKKELNDFLITKSNMSNPIGEANFALSPNFLILLALPIAYPVLILINKMMPLNVNTVTSLKLVLPSSPMPMFPSNTGMMLSPLPII